ncbi:hypothetical protein EZ449_18795 [Pedobacter frigidisoli]|uniref:Haem-binding uptake, Tiki superfamily, ChaN n=1 Tax=Pedobacter frigidisoli TaxID=2530455 RepID=A0A4R0NMN7_9SPHI|nr:DUF5694 domain-containing protein [Pedobacter frigidisoli]TCD02111.1 hypothetical protein EZ449_18795 [Pedobacter frigidisoli]
MKFKLTLTIVLLTLSTIAYAQSQKTDLLILGSDHLSQIYKTDNPRTDVLLPKRQKEIKEFINLVAPYNPDLVMVEVLPEHQKEIDSLYSLFLQNKLNFGNLSDGRSEVYQLAFRISKQLNLPKVYCVNALGGTSQSILDNGENIELYKSEGLALRTIVNEKYKALQKDSLSLKDYLIFLNQQQTYSKVYHLRYITPARVINGTFKNPDALIDTAFIDSKYIGAELISAFKNRDYKIYSNIVTSQKSESAKRVLLIIGVAHIGSLKNIIRDDEEFNLIEADKYLNK